MQPTKKVDASTPTKSNTKPSVQNSNIHGYPFTVTLTRYPGGEVRYRERVNIPPKGDGRRNEYKYSIGEEDRLRIQSLVAEEDDVSQEAEDGSGQESLVNSSKFHDAQRRHSKQGRAGYGALPDREHKFGRAARNHVRWSASALEERFGRDRCIFLTGTLPGSTDAAMRSFASWSSWVADRVQKWLRDNFSHTGDDGVTDLYHVYVWEYQRRGALHYHGLVVTSEYERIADTWPKFWVELLKQGCDISGVDWFERRKGGTWKGFDQVCRADAQITYKSVAAYLAKYLSKGPTNTSGNQLKDTPPPPARYWGRTRNVRRLVIEITTQYELPPMASEDIPHVRGLVEAYFEQRADWSARTVARLKERDESGTVVGHRDLYLGCIGYFGVYDYESPQSLAEIIAAYWGDNWTTARERYKNYHSETNRKTSEVAARRAIAEVSTIRDGATAIKWEPSPKRTLAQWVKYLKETY